MRIEFEKGHSNHFKQAMIRNATNDDDDEVWEEREPFYSKPLNGSHCALNSTHLLKGQLSQLETSEIVTIKAGHRYI